MKLNLNNYNPTKRSVRDDALLVKSLKKRSPDLEQAIFRAVFNIFIFIYLYFTSLTDTIVKICFLITVTSCLMLWYIYHNPIGSTLRRWATLLFDISGTSFGLYAGQTAGGAFIGVYLWLIVGYGLRYGKSFSRGAYVLSLIGFCLAISTNSFWLSHIDIVVGFLLTLSLIPILIMHIQANLELAVEKANASNEAKSKFLSHMSHEIRTPLNGIVGATDLLNNTNLNEDQRNFTYHIRNASILLCQLVNDVLDLAKIENGKVELNITSFSLNQIFRDVFKSFEIQAKQKGVQFSCAIDPSCESNIKGDSLYIKQVLNNFVSNAIKFTKSGSIQLKAKQVSIDNKSVVIQFSIKDTGIGIAKEKQELIFESFEQGSHAVKETFGGTGLGMSIAKNLIKIMNGSQVNVESELGKGSVFSFTIPFEREFGEILITKTDDIKVEHKTISIKNRLFDKKKHTVLIADDNQTNRYILTHIMKSKGYVVVEAEDGEKALDALRDNHIDLIMIDLNMPHYDGLEVLQLHRQLTNKRLPSIVLTADATVATKERCAEVGVDGFLTKPYNAEQILSNVESILYTVHEENFDKYYTDENSVESVVDEKLIDTYILDELKQLSPEPDFIKTLINGFLSDAENSLNIMKVAVEKADYVKYHNKAHSLKGTAGDVGAEKFYHLCIAMNEILPNDDCSKWNELLSEAMEAFNKTKVELLKYTSNNENEALVSNA